MLKRLILASSSPRRKELLNKAGFRFEVMPTNIDEKSSEAKPGRYAADIAKQKAEFAAKMTKDGIIISADTVVFIDDKIVGKVKTKKEAFAMLTALSDKTHYVYTGVCIKDMYQNKTVSFVGKSSVTFNKLTKAEIMRYIENEKDLFNLAGAYAIQSGASIFVKKITGDYNNILGLPVAEVYEKLKLLGYSFV